MTVLAAAAALPAKLSLPDSCFFAQMGGGPVTEVDRGDLRDAPGIVPERPSRSDFLVLFRTFYPRVPLASRPHHPFGMSSGTPLEACSQIISWPACLIARCAALAPSVILLKLATRGPHRAIWSTEYCGISRPYEARPLLRTHSTTVLQPVDRGHPLSATTQHRLRSRECSGQPHTSKRSGGRGDGELSVDREDVIRAGGQTGSFDRGQSRLDEFGMARLLFIRWLDLCRFLLASMSTGPAGRTEVWLPILHQPRPAEQCWGLVNP